MSIKSKVRQLLEFSPFPMGPVGIGSAPLSEMPHSEYLPGKFIDFKSELHHKLWFNTVINLFKNNKDRQQEMIDNLVKDRVFVLFFKGDFNKLRDEEKANVIKNLPKQFIQRMGI